MLLNIFKYFSKLPFFVLDLTLFFFDIIKLIVKLNMNSFHCYVSNTIE